MRWLSEVVEVNEMNEMNETASPITDVLSSEMKCGN